MGDLEFCRQECKIKSRELVAEGYSCQWFSYLQLFERFKMMAFIEMAKLLPLIREKIIQYLRLLLTRNPLWIFVQNRKKINL